MVAVIAATAQGVYAMNRSRRLTRRNALQLGAAAAALPLVHIRTAGAAGKLTVGFWDHWVAPANDAMKKQVQAWADKNKVDVTVDFITSNGSKIQITQAAEAQARTGHDFLPFYNWEVNTYADQLEPVDDVVKAMTGQYGQYGPIHEYLSKIKGHWRALPSSTGTLNLNCCGRISLLKQHAGIDVLAMYPAHKSDPSAAASWTYDTFLQAAEACQKAGFAFGLGLGQTGDSVNNTGIIYSAFGAELVNAKGEITVDSDAMNQLLDYARKLATFLPPDTVSYDDASNNRALISGQSALIMNPPSAWSVAISSAMYRCNGVTLASMRGEAVVDTYSVTEFIGGYDRGFHDRGPGRRDRAVAGTFATGLGCGQDVLGRGLPVRRHAATGGRGTRSGGHREPAQDRARAAGRL